MKKRKLISMLLTFVLIVSAIGITTAFAANYTEEFRHNFTQPYTYYKASGAVVIDYRPYPAEAWTRISVSADATAYSYVALRSVTDVNFTSYNRNASGGYVNSGHAIGDNDTAKQVVHSGYRTTNGVTTSWSYRAY